LEASPPRADGPPALLLARVRPWIAMAGLPPRYRACLDRLRAGLQLAADPAEPPGPGLAAAYAAGRAALRAYLRARPYVLEHALLNQVYLGNFPFHPARGFFAEHAVLAARHALLKLHLIGAAAAAGSLSDAVVVETVQAFDKYADSPDYWERTLRLLHREGALNQSGLADLLLD
jgi:hypothetical protein